MAYQSSSLRPVFQFAFRTIAKTADKARRAVPAAILCFTLLTLGVVGLTKVNGAFGTPARPQAGSGCGPTFTSFDAPGAGTSILQGTGGANINDGVDITGIYLTPPNVAHGFVRSGATGTITDFDAPGAGTSLNQGTFAISINTAGDIAGVYSDTITAEHGFVRSGATGTIAEFDVPGAPTTTPHRGTSPDSINGAGDITGLYVDAGAVRHGFVRSTAGTFTTFDVPGAGTNLTQGTIPLSINAAGDIAGFYLDANQLTHGFLRAANGTITAPIDAPGASTTGKTKKGFSFSGTLADSIDTAGDIAGSYADTNGVLHGFVRTAGGTITTFDVTGAGTVGLFPGTIPTSMNSTGDIAGFYADVSGVNHGFIRAAAGTITAPIDAPGASTTGMFTGTVPFSINTDDDLAGLYVDTKGVFHAFVLSSGTVAAPTFSPPAGTYSGAQSVTLADTTTGAAIYYTTDGSTPTTSSTLYTGPIAVSATETIEAIATVSGCATSGVATATYTIAPAAATPTFSPVAGTYTSVQTVTINDATAGAAIYYTTNGTTPTTASTKYTGPIAVNSTETIMALAVASGFANSAVASATYTINLPVPGFQVSVNPTTLTIVAGQSGKATFTVTPQNGFNSQVSFACSGLPSEAACSFNPSSVTPAGAAATSTLTVTTTAASAVLLMPTPFAQRPIYTFLISLLAVLLGVAACRNRAARGLQVLGLLILLIVASGLASCGGGSGGNPGTPIGTSSASVSATPSGAGSLSHTATLTITITH